MNLKFIIFVCLIWFACARHSSAGEVYTFSGTLDLKKQELELILEDKGEATVLVKSKKPSENDYLLQFTLDHFKTPIFELSSEIDGLIEVNRQENDLVDFISGKIRSQYSLIDRKPIDEVSGYFEIRGQRLVVPFLDFGEVRCEGTIHLDDPYTADLTFYLNGVPMQDFLKAWIPGNNYLSSGEVFGTIRVSGALGELSLKGNLESRDGHVNDLLFNTFELNAEGFYPHLQISKSLISEKGGMAYTFEGPFNLQDTVNFKKQVKALDIAPLVKSSDDQIEWTIHSSDKERLGRTEVKYLLKKEEGSTTAEDKSSAMIGFERKMEF